MARLEPHFREASELSVEDIAAIVGLARRQVQLMDELQIALESCDDLRALGVARELVGLEQQLMKD